MAPHVRSQYRNSLICPACLPYENRLGINIAEELEEDIIAGSLACTACGKEYPIKNGVALLDPTPDWDSVHATYKYETVPVLASYMWSHFGDLLGEEHASDAYNKWAELMRGHSGIAIDAGSAVGRFTFEMSERCDFAIGIDNSMSFIQSARYLMKNRQMTVAIQKEGLLSRDITIRLPEKWDSNKVEFLVADAQALPLRSEIANSFTSLNLVDKVPEPMKHLLEMNRVVKKRDTQFLLSDPFSWSTDVANEENWLGGKNNGYFSGHGIDNIISLLKGEKEALPPDWAIENSGEIWWKIRTHSNHYELIRSCFVKASR
jgi:SAM-dependent methyltransferase